MTILYVEDDQEDCEIFREAVNCIAPYHTLLCVEDAKHAQQALEKFLPDYIFLDINLPGVTGIQFLRTIKQSPNLKVIPVIMFTTSKNQTDEIECKKYGAADYISKPPMFQQLCDTLKRYLWVNWHHSIYLIVDDRARARK